MDHIKVTYIYQIFYYILFWSCNYFYDLISNIFFLCYLDNTTKSKDDMQNFLFRIRLYGFNYLLFFLLKKHINLLYVLGIRAWRIYRSAWVIFFNLENLFLDEMKKLLHILTGINILHCIRYSKSNLDIQKYHIY